jgi:regulatory protein YycI of two-component signal transduction system YycFG
VKDLDWSRARDTLIWALVVVNLILGVYVFMDYKTNPYTSKSVEDTESVLKLLNESKIYIPKLIKVRKDKMKDIVLEYERYDIEEEGLKFFSGDFVIDGNIASKRNEKIYITSKNEFLYVKDVDKEPFGYIGETDAKEIGFDFLSKYGFDQNVEFWDYKVDDEGEKVIFKESYNDNFIEDANMTIVIYDGDVIGFKRKWLRVKEEKDTNKDIVPVSKALYKFMVQKNLKDPDRENPVVIEDVDLGYRLNIGNFTNSNIIASSIASGEANVYWRIKTSDGKAYFIGASVD